MSQHISNTEVEYEDIKIVGHPKLHILKVVELDDFIVIYFSNNGSNIFNIDIKSPDVQNISIEPIKNIPNNSTGCIKFSSNNIINDKITLLLNYSDGKMNTISKKYLFSILNKKIEEIY